MRVSGILNEHLGDFLALWTVGYLFGKTLRVDMKYTRKHGVLRILIGCLNHTKIPTTFPVLIKKYLYTLYFEVEGEEKYENNDVIMSESGRDHDDDDEVGDDFREALDKQVEDQRGYKVVGETRKNDAAVAPGDAAGHSSRNNVARCSGVIFSPLVTRTFQMDRDSFVRDRELLLARGSGPIKEKLNLDG